MNYEEAINYINEASKRGSILGLERVKELLDLMGTPQDNLKIIHVTGTNGKGSVCAMIESILRYSGLTTGLFTSPYIWRLNESIRFNGNDISDAEFANTVEQVATFVESMVTPPTEFELLLAVALSYFKKNNCDIVILEAGMGGLLDATNVTTTCALSIITNVEHDHTSFLGSTIAEIAFQKAGLIKHRCPVIFGGVRNEALEEIKQQSETMNAKLLLVDYTLLHNVLCTLDGVAFDFDNLTNLKMPLLGLYQPKNAAIVLTAISILKKSGFIIPDIAIRKGLLHTVWSGRFEIMSKIPLVIYDGAHNVAGMTMTKQSIKHYFKANKVNVLMGVMADKDYDSMVDILSSCIEVAFTVTPCNSRSLSSYKLSQCFISHGIKQVINGDDINTTVYNAIEKSFNTNTPLIILGTLYMYEDIKRAITYTTDNILNKN